MCSLRFSRLQLMLLLTWVLVSTTSTTAAAATSTKVLDFIDLISHHFDNQWQVEEDKKYGRPSHSHLQIIFIPAKVPALSSAYTLLHLELVDNQLERQEISVVTEDQDGTIRRSRYNITNTDKFSLDSVDNLDSIDLSGLLNLTPEDLKERKECEATFSQIESNVFFGLFPDCEHQRNGMVPQYQTVNSCSALSTFPPPKAFERYNKVPYITKSLRSFSKTHEMLTAAGIDSYTSPCPER